MLEPQVGRLFLSERDGGVERERALGVARRVPVDSVDGIGRSDGVAVVSPCREVLVRPLERSLVHVHASLGHGLARVALIGGIRLDDGVRDDGNGPRVQGETARLPKSVVDFGTFRGTSQFNRIAVERHFGRQQQDVLAHDPTRRYAAHARRPGGCVGGLDEHAVPGHVFHPFCQAVGGVEPTCGKARDSIQESAVREHVSIALGHQGRGVEHWSLRDGALLEHVPVASLGERRGRKFGSLGQRRAPAEQGAVAVFLERRCRENEVFRRNHRSFLEQRTEDVGGVREGRAFGEVVSIQKAHDVAFDVVGRGSSLESGIIILVLGISRVDSPESYQVALRYGKGRPFRRGR